jgi:hypothetical protein
MAVMNLGQVMFKGKTSEALELLRGKIYSATIAKEELNDYRQHHKVISTKVSDGKIIVHVLNDTLPNNKFVAVDADLEDVYFSYINVNKN